MSTLVRLLGTIYIIVSFILFCYIFNEMVFIEQRDTSYYGNYETDQDDYEVNGAAIAAGIGVLFQGVFFGSSALCVASTKDRVDDIYFAVSKNVKSETEEISKQSGEGISFEYVTVDGVKHKKCLKCGAITEGIYTEKCKACGSDISN